MVNGVINITITMCVMITACRSICTALSINACASHAYGAEMLSKRQSEKNGHKQEEKRKKERKKKIGGGSQS